MVVLYFITVFVISILLLVKQFGNALWYSMKLPGPPALPIVGNGLLFLNKTAAEFLDISVKLVKEYGNCCRIWLGPELHVFTADPKDVEAILGSQKLIEKSNDYSLILPWLGDGLLLSKGRKWFARRKAITPTFHFKILEQFVETFDRQGQIFVKQLEKFAKTNETFDVYPLVTLCALDVICESAMGTTANAQVNSNSEYVRAVKELVHIIHIRMFDFLMRNDFLFYIFSSYYNRQIRALKIVHDFTDDVIVKRREELIQRSNSNKLYNEKTNEESDLGIKKRMAFLDVLLQSTIEGMPLSNIDIREEVDTFMFEGHDTTTSAICFALYNLAKYPNVQAKVLEEIKSVFGDEDTTPITLSLLNELHYTELVIKETLRLYPSVPFYARKLRNNTEINGKIFPKGSNLVISPYIMGRDPNLFPDPESFIPERFDVVTNTEKTNPYSYVPFSAGPRNCIGQKFAVLELKSTICKVVRSYVIELPKQLEKPVLVAELILRPENGVNIKIKAR